MKHEKLHPVWEKICAAHREYAMQRAAKRARKAIRKESQRQIEQLCDESVAAKVNPGLLSGLFGFAAIIQAVTPKADPKNTVLIMPPRVRRAIIKGVKKGKGRK